MNESQEIRYNRILKKLEDAEKGLKELAYTGQFQPLNSAELECVESALNYVIKAIDCL